jgi:hypothetical protein
MTKTHVAGFAREVGARWVDAMTLPAAEPRGGFEPHCASPQAPQGHGRG